jgi:sporulation protein YlmC with PRC-barrel domain
MIVSCARLAGHVVVNPSDEDVGQIERIMIDVPTGRIAYAVVGYGGVLGIGQRYYAVPWQYLTRDPERPRFVLERDPEKLQSVPA